MAHIPNVMIRSFKKGTATTLSAPPVTGFFISINLKKTNNSKAMLQIKVNFDKKLNKRIGSELGDNKKQYSKNYPKPGYDTAIYYYNH